jgi:hypothetical protein
MEVRVPPSGPPRLRIATAAQKERVTIGNVTLAKEERRDVLHLLTVRNKLA